MDGKAVHSQTLAASVGAYVLVIATTLPDQTIDLHSTYAGHSRTNTLASHLLLARDAYDAIAVEHEHDELPSPTRAGAASTTICTTYRHCWTASGTQSASPLRTRRSPSWRAEPTHGCYEGLHLYSPGSGRKSWRALP